MTTSNDEVVTDSSPYNKEASSERSKEIFKKEIYS
jgi:hypothetical protein